MVERMTPGPVVIPWEHRGGAHRACPTCAKTMEATSLASVALDRCAADGIWFDAQELQRVLQQTPHDPRRENGDDLFALLFKWLRELATRR